MMAWIDETAAIVGRCHTQMNITTATVENLRFLYGAYMRDTVILRGRVTYVGNTSMEVKVETYVERMSGEKLLINRAFLTVVGVDNDGKPQRLPRIILETEEDKVEWKAAEERREIRKKEYGV